MLTLLKYNYRVWADGSCDIIKGGILYEKNRCSCPRTGNAPLCGAC